VHRCTYELSGLSDALKHVIRLAANKWLHDNSAAQARREGVRGEFSRTPRRFGGPPSLNNTETAVPDGLLLSSNMHKIHFRPGLCPDPVEELTTLSQAPAWSDGEGREHPSPRFLPLDASISTLTEIVIGPHENGFRASLWLSTGLLPRIILIRMIVRYRPADGWYIDEGLDLLEIAQQAFLSVFLCSPPPLSLFLLPLITSSSNQVTPTREG